MSRRTDRQRIYEAQRAGTKRRLTLDGMSEVDAEAWIVSWEAQTASDGLDHGSAYWETAWQWIAAERQHRRRP